MRQKQNGQQPPPNQKDGRWFKRLQAALLMHTSELAEELEVSVRSVQRYREGTRRPDAFRLKWLKQLAARKDVPWPK